jgi:hypothetical protein
MNLFFERDYERHKKYHAMQLHDTQPDTAMVNMKYN